jgi:tetratricopeptide (TPR) repeat protein
MKSSLWNYLLTVVVSAAMGSGLTLLITSQRSKSNTHSLASPSAPFNTKPEVSGLSPGQAAVVRGNFAYDRQNWPEAIREYQQAIAHGVDNADVRTDLGNAFRFSAQPQQALEQYRIAQNLNPQHENSLFNQISLYTEVLHDPAHAIPVCEEFMRRFPSSTKLTAVQQQLELARKSLP